MEGQSKTEAGETEGKASEGEEAVRETQMQTEERWREGGREIGGG